MSVRSLAALAGVSHSYLANLESGKSKPDPELFERVRVALMRTVEDMAEIGNMRAPEDPQPRLYKGVADLLADDDLMALFSITPQEEELMREWSILSRGPRTAQDALQLLLAIRSSCRERSR